MVATVKGAGDSFSHLPTTREVPGQKRTPPPVPPRRGSNAQMDGLSGLGPRPRQGGIDDGQGGMGSAPTGRRPLNNPFLNMSKEPQVMHDMGQRARDMGTEMASDAFHTFAQHAPLPFAPALDFAANMISPTPFSTGIAGGQLNQMKQQQHEMLKQQTEMARINNENTLNAALIQQSQALTGALASVANAGVNNIKDAAKGQ
ncbi:hypothetical protein GXB81_28635 [Paraburkholderia sp. Ac-20336]|uniref:hypothetical protein n=2 Tax=Burkholderiales TaxID=80840 RepID=UPI00141F8D39|nr:hypothetical protein [Paraburkholderia sp. Cy-641]MBN3806982.1 hypothetical protein [Paraburkholderia sp. Ac-20336]NIF77798.1 hypothetical protein [Paraburkholderia sp. Cy-641]